MTTITAKIIADSKNALDGSRLTTMQLRYPRCIHAEFMTHRVFSRNASSSRAIPVERLIQDVLDDPFVPLHWGKNQKGMQANGECSERIDHGYSLLKGENGNLTRVDTTDKLSRETAWKVAMFHAVDAARAFSKAGYHKQLVNRLLEPFAHINVVVTSTNWSNFLALRDHPDAEPHIQLLAKAVRKALDESTPVLLQEGQWHAPYLNDEDWDQHQGENLVKVSVARCARVSYMTHDGRVPDFDEDLALANRLLDSVPLHASPAEHQACVEDGGELCGNLFGYWTQYRKTLDGECQ